MLKELKKFWQEEDGMGTVEIVLIIAVLVALVIIFRKAIIDFMNSATKSVFKAASENQDPNSLAGGKG